MKGSKPYLLVCFLWFLLLPQGASCQDFSSIDNDLQQLENLIADTLSNSEAQQTLLDDLKQSLTISDLLLKTYENTITEQEQLLKNLQTHLAEMSEIYRTQSALSQKFEKSSKPPYRVAVLEDFYTDSDPGNSPR